MELHQIRYFVVLCETLSFARAAEKCGVSPPTLSRAIQKLEHELGGVLIRRERRLTHLTELGRLLRPMLEEVLAHTESSKAAALKFVSVRERPIKIGILPSIGLLRLAKFMADFRQRFPQPELSFEEAAAEPLRVQLLSGNLDVAIATKSGVKDIRFRHTPLYRESMMVVFPAGHRFEGQQSVRLVDLRDENYLLRVNCEARTFILDTCRKLGFEPKIANRSDREDRIQMMVAAGLGITLMTENMHSGQGTAARPLVEPSLSREVSLVTVSGRPRDLTVRRLTDAIRTYKWDEPATPGSRAGAGGPTRTSGRFDPLPPSAR